MAPTLSDPMTTARRRWAVLTLLTGVEFIIFLDIAIVNVALPAIKAGLSFSEADLAWVVNAYHLVFGGLLILGGRAADLLGRRRMFVAGLACFTLGSLLAGLPSASLPIVGRALQGLGAALVVPAGQSLIVTIFTDAREFNRAFGIWSAMKAAGAASGVALGGIITQFFGWPWIFLINVPICILALLLSPALLPRDDVARGWGKLDLPGALAVTSALLLLVYGLGEVSGPGLDSVHTGGALLASLLLAAIFVWIEARGVPAGAAAPPGPPRAQRGDHRQPAGGGFPRTDVLLPVALPAGGARVRCARSRIGAPADRADQHRRLERRDRERARALRL
jgi:MFS family permease